jgi:homoserine O-acetyltransferase
MMRIAKIGAVVTGLLAACMAFAAMAAPEPDAHDYVIRDFHFRSGETLRELKLHYYTLGQPRRDAAGHIVNAVVILHGTGGSGRQFLQPQFADVLLVPGGLLDPAKYFIIMPDGIGHGGSSKPSDGLKMTFPHYDYADMVEAHHRLIRQELGVEKLRLVMGTSMGCMHIFVWGEAYPDDAKAWMPLACQSVALGGRNRMWRKLAIDGIRSDPAWRNGDYASQPAQGLRTAESLLWLAGQSPLPLQLAMPRGEQVDAWVTAEFAKRTEPLDANDLIYQLEASRTYDPSPGLEKITAPLTWVNSADDFINPPELGIAPVEARRLKAGRFVLIPASKDTHGHGTHTWAALWKDELAALLKRSGG